MSENNALSRYIAKLDKQSSLSSENCNILRSMTGLVRQYSPGERVVDEEIASSHCIVIDSGFFSRGRTMANGGRQIVGFQMAGDAMHPLSLRVQSTKNDIIAHTKATTFWIAHTDILLVSETSQAITKALWLDSLRDGAIALEWIVNVGHRSARERIAHLLLELSVRFSHVELLDEDTYELPITQGVMAKALGLSLVHLNKSFQTLKKDGLVRTHGRMITLIDRSKLIDLSSFDPAYLQLDAYRACSATDASNGPYMRIGDETHQSGPHARSIQGAREKHEQSAQGTVTISTIRSAVMLFGTINLVRTALSRAPKAYQ
jgi:CRP-like cAMP-binding protein